MRVKLLREKTVILDATNSQTWPADWAGDVVPEFLKLWKEGVDYEVLPLTAESLTPGQQFTAQQAAALALVAEQVIAQSTQIDAGAGGADVADGAAEPVVAPDVDAAGEDVANMSKEEKIALLEQLDAGQINALAKDRGVKYVGVKRAAVIEALASL